MIDSTHITFVIPAYNASTTLKESVDSIFNSNFEYGDEVIIVDDCSNDSTLAVSKELALSYKPHITVIHNDENKGCPASRNVGIRTSKNELIFNLDSDNILPPHSINSLKKALAENEADLASFSDYQYFRESTSEITHKWKCKQGIFSLADLFSGMTNPAPGGNFMYRKSMWDKVGGYWEYGKGLHEAWGFSFKMLVNGAKFFVVPNTFYYHRYSHESLFARENKRSNESIRVSNLFIQKYLDIFDEKSIHYIQSNPDWFNSLEKHPLQLKGDKRGINGKIIFTSAIKQLFYLIKKRIS